MPHTTVFVNLYVCSGCAPFQGVCFPLCMRAWMKPGVIQHRVCVFAYVCMCVIVLSMFVSVHDNVCVCNWR